MVKSISVPRLKQLVLDTRDEIDMPSRIHQAISEAVKANFFAEGMPLPDVKLIATSLGVSEATVRNGMARLVNDGTVASRRGRGGGYWIAARRDALARLTDEFIALARTLERDETIAETLRERFSPLDALYAKRKRQNAGRYFGKFRSGLTDVSVNHDRYLDS